MRITTSGKVTGTAGGIVVANLGINVGDAVNITDNTSDVDSLAIVTTNDKASFIDADDFVINSVDGVSGVNTGTGNASLSAGGAVTQSKDVTAAGLELLGAGSFTLTSASNDVDIIAGNTTNAVNFTDIDGLNVGTVNSVGLTTGGNTKLTAAGTLAFDQVLKAAGFKAELSGSSIVDNTPAATDVEAASASFTASIGIGSANALDTKVSTVAAITTTGDVQIGNQGVLTIGTVGTVIGVTGGGGAVISAASPLTVSSNVVMGGNITLTAGEISDSPVFADDLTIQTGVTVQSTVGDVTLQAGDDIIMQAGSFLIAAGTANLIAGFGDLDSSGTLNLSGTIIVGTDLNICSVSDLKVPTLIAAGTISLRSMAGQIVDNNGVAVNVTASALAMQAANGIGIGDALETVVNTFEAETATGGIFVDNNAASLTIGDILAPGCGMVLDGVRATTSGDIKLTNIGSILLTESGQDVQTFGGDVTLIASTPSGDLTTGTGTAYGNVYASGKVSLQAGRDITLGYNSYYGDVQAGADVTISAGRHITVQDFTYVFTNGAGSPMNFTAGTSGGIGNISIIKGSVSGATVFNNAATGGPINFTTAAGGVFTNTVPNGGVVSSGGDITVIADDMNITRPINAAAGIVTLKQVTNSQAINFGGVGGLNLIDAELDNVTASVLRIGDANSGAMTINQNISPAKASTLHLTTGNTVTGSAFGVTVQDLAVKADGVVDLSSTNNNVSKLAIVTSNDTVTYVDINGFDIGSVDGVNGVNVGTADASLKAGAAVTDSQPVAASGLALRGAGSFTLDAVGTNVSTLAADNSGNVTIDDSTGFDIGSVFGVNGVTNVPTLAVTAGGAVTDSQAIAVTNLLLRGAGPFTLDTASNNWTTMASDATGNVTIVDVNGFGVGTVNGVNGVNLGAGTFSVTSGGTLSQTQAVKAGGLELFGIGPFNLNGVATNDVNTLAGNVSGNVNLIDADDVTIGTVNATSGLTLAGADADVKAGGDLTLAEAISGGGTMFLTSSAKIIDAHVGTDVSGSKLGATAGTGIGSADAIDTAIGTLAATSTSGAINVANSGPLTIGTVGAIVGLTGGGSADISTASPLTVASNVIMTGSIVMTAGEISDFPTCADDLTVNGGVAVQSTGGDVTLQAGDDVILQAGSIVSAFGNVTLTAGYNDLDTCGDLILNGTISGGGNIDLCALTDLTVGSVTSTGGTVTLRSVNGAIIDGNGAANNVTAPALAMGANKGIGTLLDHLETQVNAIEALDFLGGIFVDNNTASLKVGGVTPGCGLFLTGVEEFAGDVLLTNTGDLLIDQGEGVFANNDATLKATGATADIRTGGNITAISASNDVNLQAGDDVELGDTAGFAYGDTFAGNNVNVTSGGDFVVGAFTYVTANSGSITANATGNIDVTNAGGYSSHLQAGNDVVLTAAGTFNHSPGGNGYISAGDDVQIMAKSMTTANLISAGDDVTLTSTTGDITDTTPSGYSGYNDTAVHGDLVTVSSAGKVDLDIDANNLTSTANGASTFREINGVIVNSITAAGNLITLGNCNGSSTFTLLNGDALNDASTVSVDSGTLVDLNGDDETIGALQGFGDVDIGSQTLTTGGNNASTSFGGVMSGTGGNVIKLGSGIFTISGANTYTGTTSVLFGTLKMGASNVLDDASSLIVNGATAVFAMNTFNDIVLAVSLINGTISGPGTLTSQTNFDVQSGLVTANFAGGVGLVKTTAGTVTLAGANTYVGVSLINGGVLNLTGSLTGSGGDVILNANGVTLDGLGSGVITGRGVVVNTNKTATFVQNLAQVTAGPSLTGLVVGKGGSASILNNTINNNHIGIQVDGGTALIQGNNLSNNNKGTASTAAGLVASNGGIVDAGQNASVYYTHFTLLAGGTGPGGASNGNNVFLGYPYLGATDWLANVPKAIRNNNTGGAYSKVGPQFGTNDLTAMNNTYDGTPSLFLIEKELYHDIDDFTRGFITYGNSTTPATMTDLRYYAVNPTQTYASGPPDYTLMTAGNPTGTYQASEIRRLQATFNGYVFIDQTKAGTSVPVGGPIAGTGGIQIYKKNGPSLTFSNTTGFVNVNTLSAFYDQNTGSYSVNFGFSNPAGQYLVEPNGSLTDGNYDLGLIGSLIQGGGPGGAALTNGGTRSFYRFFGDFNGDRRVNNLDLAAMQASLARKPGDAAYRGYFNFDTIDLISGADYNAFVRRYRNQLNVDGTTTAIVP